MKILRIQFLMECDVLLVVTVHEFLISLLAMVIGSSSTSCHALGQFSDDLPRTLVGITRLPAGSVISTFWLRTSARLVGLM